MRSSYAGFIALFIFFSLVPQTAQSIVKGSSATEGVWKIDQSDIDLNLLDFRFPERSSESERNPIVLLQFCILDMSIDDTNQLRMADGKGKILVAWSTSTGIDPGCVYFLAQDLRIKLKNNQGSANGTWRLLILN